LTQVKLGGSTAVAAQPHKDTAQRIPPPPPRNPLLRIYPALSVPAFRMTWAGMLPAQIAITAGEIATPYAAFALTGSATAIGLVSLVAGLPMMLFTLVGGVVADRLPRRIVLISAQLTFLIVTATLTSIVASGRLEVWHLAAVGAIQSTLFSFNMPAYQAFIAELVPRSLIRNAVALHMTGFNLSRIIGPSLAGAMLAVPALGLTAIYASMTAMYGLALASLIPGRRLEPLPPTAELTKRPSGWAHLIEGLRYVTAAPLMRTLLLMGLIPVLFTMPLQALLPIFVARVYEAGPGVLGVLSAAIGLGALVGSVFGASLTHHSRPVGVQLTIGLLLGVAVIGFGLAPTYWVAVPVAALIGFCQLTYMVLNNGMIISSAEPRLHGRVSSVNMLRFSMTPISILIATWLSDLIGPQWTVAIGGTITVLAMALIGLRNAELWQPE
jgi:MFS family permease